MVEGKIFYSCFYRNRNGTRKCVNFERGENCVTPTNNPYWKNDIKEKYFIKLKAQHIPEFMQKNQNKVVLMLLHTLNYKLYIYFFVKLIDQKSNKKYELQIYKYL